MRNSLLDKDPGIEAVDMRTLVGIANAIENEAVRRYAMLAELMERRGEAATAAAFRVMLEEERRHVQAVEQWAAGIGEAVPAPEAYEWQLPEDLSTSWEEISGSALLTPYRAFALAVENEQRAFTFYAYLAAHADNAQVMAEAEKLGAEELRHASLMRRFRRRAWHRERRPARLPDLTVESSKALREVLVQHEAVIARRYRELAAHLRALGDEESAAILEAALAASSAPAAASAAERAGMRNGTLARGRDPVAVAGGEGASGLLVGWAEGNAEDGPDTSTEPDPAHLLIDAQKPLEALSETLEAIMRTTEGPLFAEAEAAMMNVVTRLARISLQAAHRMQEAAEVRGTASTTG